MEQCKMITISEKTYPIRFDYTVLEKVAEKYPNIHKFEMELIGCTLVKNKDGEEAPQITKDPSISCIMFLLPLMINSALDYQGFEQVDKKQIIQEIDLNYIELAGILHTEMSKCFKSSVVQKKKYIPNPK